MKSLEIINLSALAFFVVWGFIVSTEDLKTNKVSNKRIILGLKVFGIFILAQFVNTLLGISGMVTSYLNAVYFKYQLYNFLLILMSGMVMWYGEIWPAGDAKFFMVSVLLLPLANPSAAGFPGYLWISILINTFVVAAIYSVARFFYDSYKMKLSGDNDAFKEIDEFKNKAMAFFSENGGKTAAKKIAVLFFSIGIIFLMKQVLNMYMMNWLGRNFSKAYIIYFLLFFAWEKAGKIFEKRGWKIAMSILYVAYFVLGWFYFRDDLLKNLHRALGNVFKFSIILTVGRFVLEYLVEKKNAYWVDSSQLKEGMILSSDTIRQARMNDEISSFFDDYYKDGLSGEQVEALKLWMAKIPKENAKLEMVKGYPFAMWIYVGCLIELIFNKSVLTFLKL